MVVAELITHLQEQPNQQAEVTYYSASNDCFFKIRNIEQMAAFHISMNGLDYYVKVDDSVAGKTMIVNLDAL